MEIQINNKSTQNNKVFFECSLDGRCYPPQRHIFEGEKLRTRKKAEEIADVDLADVDLLHNG